MESFLQFLFVGFIFVVALRYLFPLLLRFWVQHVLKKKMKQSGFHYENTHNQHDNSTTISGNQPETKVPKDMGEYVDFENIE